MKTYYLFICSIFNCYDLNFLPNKSQKRSSKFSNEIISYFTITSYLWSSDYWSSKSLGTVEKRTKSQWRSERGKDTFCSQFLTVTIKFLSRCGKLLAHWSESALKKTATSKNFMKFTTIWLSRTRYCWNMINANRLLDSKMIPSFWQDIFQYVEKKVGRNRNQQVTVNGLNQDEFKISLRACFNALKDLCPR